MAPEHCLILCKSIHHGNTVKVAEAVGAVLHADVVAPEHVPYAMLSQTRLTGFASGVYYGRMHEALFAWLRGLPDAATPSMPAFLFSTSGLPWLSWLWHRPLRRLLARKGFHIVGEFSCGGYDTWGPLWFTGGLNRSHPNQHDLRRAEAFATAIDRKLPHLESVNQLRIASLTARP